MSQAAQAHRVMAASWYAGQICRRQTDPVFPSLAGEGTD
jgi:hypothetical protein